nr:hypothetical protein [Tanacetum cinerariifolium]
MVPLRSDTIRLVQNGCSFHGLRSEDPNQHLKDFLKLVDSLNLDESITTWKDLTTRFLAQFFPSRRTAKLHNDILMFQQNHKESLSKAWTRFKDSLQKSIIMALTFAPSLNILWPCQSRHKMNRYLISRCGSYNTQYCIDCIEDPEQAFVEYTSSRTDEARGKKFCRIRKDMHVYVGNMRKHRLMSFTDETKEVTVKTPYKEPERSELYSEGHELLSSRVILSEDDYDRGCRKPSDIKDGFYREPLSLDPSMRLEWMMKEKSRKECDFKSSYNTRQ